MFLPARKNATHPTLAAVLASALLAALPHAAGAGTLTTIHNFTGGADGGNPVDGLTLGAGGVLFGTTSAGGSASLGTVFKIAGHAAPTILHSFAGGADGATPNSGVIENAAGTLFGTTTGGGTSGAGTVYSLQGTSEKILYSFKGGPGDGNYPQAGLVFDKNGNLYGTTKTGGTSGNGTVFQLSPPATGTGMWTEKILYNFGAGTDGAAPVGRLIVDSAGNLLGTTSIGGTTGAGTVFALLANANWKETILHNFQNGDDGNTPYAGLVGDASGNFYGAATAGGSNGGGTIFKLLPFKGSYVFKVLGSVPGSGISGTYRDVLVRSESLIYATTHCDGNGSGSIFKLTRSGGTWTYSVLYNFTGGSDGQYSISNLVFKGGAFYGTTIAGGMNGAGTVYAFQP